MRLTKSSVCVTAILLLSLCGAAVIAQSLPFNGTVATPSNVPAWQIQQSGAGRAGQFQILSVKNNNTALIGLTNGTGIGIFGRTQAGQFAIWGQNLTNGTGVFGSSNTGFGVRGNSATNAGVFGQNTNTNRVGGVAGVFGQANAEDGGRFISTTGNGLFASGGNYGVFATGGKIGARFEGTDRCAEFVGANGIIVQATNDAVVANSTADQKSGVFAFHGGANSGFGVFAVADHGVGVQGVNQSTDFGAYGVVGEVSSTNAAGLSAGVRGINNSTTGSGIGVEGSQAGSGWGVWGHVDGAGIAIRGSVGDTTNGQAGFFAGNVQIVGTLTKSSGAFKIDHPLDPENKYLSHSFVESPDMKNIYDGTVVLDGRGEAMVQLPDYFEALNRDFRYQLTCIGGFAPVYIAHEIENNSFAIAGGKPGLKVSWQVTGIRQDAYAQAHPIVVEQDKPAKEKGTLLNPEAFGQPAAPEMQ